MDEVTQDQMRARLFPFSLLGKAFQWFHSQPVEMVQDWNALMRAFIMEYYSPGKTQSLSNKVATFAQYPTETISEAFECFNEHTRAVPHHKFPKEDLVQKFYQGLTMASRTIIDASAGGSIIELTPIQAFTLFKTLTSVSTHGERQGSLASGKRRHNRRQDRLAYAEVGEDGDRKERGSRCKGC
jgi:hypothetical protein